MRLLFVLFLVSGATWAQPLSTEVQLQMNVIMKSLHTNDLKTFFQLVEIASVASNYLIVKKSEILSVNVTDAYIGNNDDTYVRASVKEKSEEFDVKIVMRKSKDSPTGRQMYAFTRCDNP